jgi:hypothetical protein
MAKPGDWMENPQNLANIGHALAGYSVLLTVVLFSHHWLPIAIVEGLLVTYVMTKEFWYDLKYETGETVKSSAVDALGYLIGNAIAWALVLFAWRLNA